MLSFRTELENPVVSKEILELEKKIRLFKDGKIPEEKFRSLRLARGVYGQRQKGVQMIRIKLPYGKISPKQLERIADISDEYSNGNLHVTTRQDIQIHHVSLDKTPELWAKLAEDDITLREACGNTVRNVTASIDAGIDPLEAFDVSPYAQAVFAYFLRKAFCQELGRKVKIAFSHNEQDTAYTFMHDIAFVARKRLINNELKRGFKVLIGGGLGAQPFLAKTLYDFLPEDQLIPLVEASLRAFDKYGERNSRHKARIKYLIQQIGTEGFLALIEDEKKGLLHASYTVDTQDFEHPELLAPNEVYPAEISQEQQALYNTWLASNTKKQKQEGYRAVYIKLRLGNISSEKARAFAKIARRFASRDIRLGINQNIQLRFVKEENLAALFVELSALALADPGYDSVADITACPGTDTCNLAISNSTSLSLALEELVETQFPHLLLDKELKIKISGCMNSCGQHAMAGIGFHGSSFKVGTQVVPAVQVLIGGAVLGSGEARIADKVIKIASKRAPSALKTLLLDFEKERNGKELFADYSLRKGKDYFYQLLKPLADHTVLEEKELIDWGQEERFSTAIGVGECAGVQIDLVATLFFEAEEKLAFSQEALDEKRWGDAAYHAYSSMVHAAKALLLQEQVHVNTQHQLLNDFDKTFTETGRIALGASLKEIAKKLPENAPNEEFAKAYLQEAKRVVGLLLQHKQQESLV